MLTKKQQASLKVGDLVLWLDKLYRVEGFSQWRSYCLTTGAEPGTLNTLDPRLESSLLEIPPPARILAYKLTQ